MAPAAEGTATSGVSPWCPPPANPDPARHTSAYGLISAPSAEQDGGRSQSRKSPKLLPYVRAACLRRQAAVVVDGDSPSAVLQAGVRVPKAAELVAAKIRRQIVSGDLPEGT